MSQQSQIMPAIIIVLDQHGGEIRGTENLARILGCPNNKSELLIYARRLALLGEIIINRSRGGRGKQTVYKRNRNPEHARRMR